MNPVLSASESDFPTAAPDQTDTLPGDRGPPESERDTVMPGPGDSTVMAWARAM